MDFNKIIKIQQTFDTEHGWTPDDNLKSRIDAINKDLIGLIGEIGEFANVIKKINLQLDKGDILSAQNLYEIHQENLSEEVTDTFIYIFRIASHLNMNVEECYFKKLEYNKGKYKGYELNNE